MTILLPARSATLIELVSDSVNKTLILVIQSRINCMERTNDIVKKTIRDEFAVLINNFLKAISLAIETDIIPKRKQYSGWMIQEGSGSHSEFFERLTFPSDLIMDKYQKKKFSNIILPEEVKLREVLERTGISKVFEAPDIPFPEGISCISRKELISDLCSQLVSNWLKLENPFYFEERDMSNLIEEFLDAILDGKILLRQRIAIDWLDGTYFPVEICDGITIRQISKEELWKFGDVNNIQNNLIYFRQYYPKDRWKIIDIRLSQEKADPSIGMRNLVYALLVLLRLGASGNLEIFDLGLRFNYGSPGVIRSNSFPMNIRGSGKTYSLDAILIERLQSYWSQIHNIMESDNHYLRLPLTRLLDGGLSNRPDDAILDYAIGLERLLTEGTRDELSYRFALRGATILSWDGGNKKVFYEDLKRFYNIRSSIVHGNQVKDIELNDAYINGEKYLREILLWYLTNGFIDAKKGLREGTDIVDNRILSASKS